MVIRNCLELLTQLSELEDYLEKIEMDSDSKKEIKKLIDQKASTA